MREITQKAIEYANMGLSVIPLGAITIGEDGKKKIKYPPTWKHLQAVRANEEQIIQWFEVEQYRNIGIITGKISQLFVLDTDSYKPTYDKELVKSFNLPITPCQTTGRGGKQYFFKYVGEAKNAEGVFKKDSCVDIRANGGMVIVPPTKTSYGEYTWEISPSEELFAPLPEQLEKLFGEKKKKELHEQLNLVEGSRDSSIASITGRLAQALPIEKWEIDIFPTIQAFNATYLPPLPKEDLIRIYRSITAKELERRNENLQPKIKFFPSISYKNLISQDFPPARFAINPFFELHTLNAVSAPPNTWKSWIVILFALAMAKGEVVFEKFGSEKLSVMIVNEEDSIRLIQDKLKMLGGKQEDLPIFFRIAQGEKLEKEYVESLLVEAKSKKVDVIIFDSLRAMHNAEENSSTEMQAVMDFLKVFTKENITIIFTHHHRKKNLFQRDSGDPEMARGSSAIGAAISGHVSLEEIEREGKKFLIVRHLKSKVSEKHPAFELLIEVEKDKSVNFVYAGEMKTADKKVMEAKDCIYSFLGSEQRWIARKELFGVCGVSDRTLKTALAELVKEENIISKTRKLLREEQVFVQTEGKSQEKMYYMSSKEELTAGEAPDDFNNF